MSTSLRQAATIMFTERSWLCIPLRKDGNGLAKVPIPRGWTSLEPTLEAVESLPWEQAEGLGIVLGEKSNNLAVLDIDDEHLAQVIMVHCWDSRDVSPRLVKTARNRLHIYFQELDSPSASSKITLQWGGRPVTVELKANGTQVAAPPIPLYELLNTPQPPMPIGSIADAWEFVVDCIKDSSMARWLELPVDAPTGAGYPKPWLENVPEGQRNDAAYIEAQQLREAGMPYDQALRVMASRFTEYYDTQAMSWTEIEKTVQSAYKKGTVVNPYVKPINELSLFNHQ